MSRSTHTIYLAVIAVLVAAVVWLVISEQETPDQMSRVWNSEESIAVLPFTSIRAEDLANPALHAISDQIVQRLSQLSILRVASRSSVAAVAHSELSITRLGEVLGVSSILEGAVQFDEDSVRVTAQLIDTATGTFLWAETYDVDVDSLDAVAANVADAVADFVRNSH